MSKQKVFIVGFLPDQKTIDETGAHKLAIAFEARDHKHAQAKAMFLLMEEYPAAQEAEHKLVLCEDSPGMPRPALDKWDEEFFYQYDWDEKLNHPVERETKVDFNKIASSSKAAVLVKYKTTDITASMYKEALELQQEEQNTFDGHLIEALNRTPEVMSMYPERIIEAIEWTQQNCSLKKKWPEIKAALNDWLKQHQQSRNESANSEIFAGVPQVIPRPYKHTYKTLDLEIAIALWVGDIDPNAPLASVTRWANGIIKEDREDWKRWSTQLRIQENILSYDRPTIFNVVRNAPAPDTYQFPESHGRYIAQYLAAHGKMEQQPNETEQNTAESTRVLEHEAPETDSVEPQYTGDDPAAGTVETAAPVERTGPFYYRTADGQPGRANKQAKLEAFIEQGCIEITKEEYQALKEAPPVQQPTSSDQPGINYLGNGRFSIEDLAPEQSQTNDKNASNEVEKTEVAAKLPPVTTFQSIGAALEHDLAGKGDNMKIWRSVMRTDPRYTKDLAGAGFEGTSINAEYMIMRATEIFGPIGTGWGFEVLEDRMLPGAPMSEAIYEDKKFIGNRLLRDGDGTLITEKNHSIKIKLWYAIEGEIRGEVEAYGATKYLYKTKHGITCDGEAQKKSLTDAIKKALSLLGFSADVWLGLYDQPEYKQENALQFELANASDKAENIPRIRKELDEKFKLNTDTMRTAVTPSEVSGIASSLTRVMGVHLKAAREKADHEYTKYLEGRLRRLEEVKSECLAKLQEKAA
ncbi:exodeoxyribonuclease VIII [Pantoea sp. RSPAM1]|uniref:exodeoxyribonuclease VIII n=1 Tax=Pantoea sp. RSPAM1 TaxID=2675223 RepID=UPI00315C6A49